jgi:hypothetical protein
MDPRIFRPMPMGLDLTHATPKAALG